MSTADPATAGCQHTPHGLIGPSILNADLASLADECQRLMDCGADYLHLDVMDGHFVPNLTFGAPLVKCLRATLGARPLFDLHMMVAQPERWVEPMAAAGGSQYTFHVEASDAPLALCRQVREAGMKVGVAIKPATSVDVIETLMAHADTVLVMTVEPGFGGQKFMSEMMDKVRRIRRSAPPHVNIEVDGGVGEANVEECAVAGANMIVSGSAVVNAARPEQVIGNMKRVVRQYFPPPSQERQ